MSPDLDPPDPTDFIPVLHWPGHRPSLGDLRTWYEALSAAIGSVLPTDLVAVWVFPERGPPVLLGPPELDADDLRLPPANPLVATEALFALEDRVHAAGFRSVMAVPVRHGARDVGLLVLATFAADRLDRRSQRTLHRIADRIGPTCGRLAERPWLRPVPLTDDVGGGTCRVLEGMLEAVDHGRSVADLVQLTSDVLGAVLPHDRVEVIAPIRVPPAWSLLGTITGTAPVDPGVVVTRRIEALVQHLGGRIATRVDRLEEYGLAWPGPPTAGRGGGAASLVAARLEVAGEFVGWLCLGSERPGWFRPEDEDTAVLAARLVAPRVAAWVARSDR